MQDSDSPFIFEKIGTQLEHVVIDEFQDTSTIQWQNFKVLLDETMSHQDAGNLIVGDVKQSIYRWRSGDWRLLNNIQEQFGDKRLDIKTLDTNYRSAKNIIDFNNAFFKAAAETEYQTLKENTPEEAEQLKIAYSDVAQRVPLGKPANGFVQIKLLNKEEWKERTLKETMATIMQLTALLGLFACLSSMPGLGGTSIGNYTLGRPLVGGLICGLILGDLKTGILVGIAMQLVYIALVTPGGTVSADVRAVSYIGIPLAMIAVHSYGLNPASREAQGLATSFGSMVGTLGTVLFYGTATINLAWQHIGWTAVEKGDFKKLYTVDWVLPWISHIICSFIPTLIMCKMGAPMVDLIKTYLPMDGLAMKTLFTVGSLLPCVGIAILLKQIVTKAVDFIPFFFGFTLAASLGINLVSATLIAALFALINYKIKMLSLSKTAVVAADDLDDDDEEDI